LSRVSLFSLMATLLASIFAPGAPAQTSAPVVPAMTDDVKPIRVTGLGIWPTFTKVAFRRKQLLLKAVGRA